MKKILVTGANGQLGSEIMNVLLKQGYVALGVDIDEMNLCHAHRIKEVLTYENPDAIIHCGAFTDVERAESLVDTCLLINASATRDIADYAKKTQIPMIYISTDYVFDGEKEQPYDEDDMPNPLNVYGSSKLQGEVYVKELLEKYFILRISWVVGRNGRNFVKTMQNLATKMEKIDVVNDQFGTPTFTADVAQLIPEFLTSDAYGTYHVTNDGFCSWAEFAREIFRLTKVAVYVNGISASEFATRATRPLNSRLNKEKLISAGFTMLPPWQDSLKKYFKEAGLDETVD